MLDAHTPADRHAPHRPGCACPACAGEPTLGVVVLAAVPPRRGVRCRPAPVPCVVLGASDGEDGPRLLVAPGAPARGRAARGDLYAAATDLKGVRDLDGPHVFVAGRPIVVPLGPDRGRADARNPVVVLGRLGAGASRRLEALRRRRGGAARA